jgi:hypothetical protein
MKTNLIRFLATLLLFTTLLTACGEKAQPSVVPTPSEGSKPQEVTSLPQNEPQDKEESQEPSKTESKEESKEEIKEESSKVSKPKSTTVKGNPVGDLGYNTNLNIEDNVFMDALIYTGYNMKKHRADGNMWVYILSECKRGLGYLSNITYGGGSSGLETTPDGKPDIRAFERGGLVCASFATYVYFNYLPNVAGIDTSMLKKPERTYNAHSFYTAAKDWIAKGQAHTIGFTVSRDGAGYIHFKEDEEIPIGSIIVFEDDRKHDGMGSHITVYGGYKNGHHWVYQVGTSNGPEMCAIERMLFGPDPQWPLKVIVPNAIRMSAYAKVTATDQKGDPVKGVQVTLKNKENGKSTTITTDKQGAGEKDGLAYGKYQLTVKAPKGYTYTATKKQVELTPKNNSENEIVITLKKIEKKKPKPQKETSKTEESESEKSEPEDTTTETSEPSTTPETPIE